MKRLGSPKRLRYRFVRQRFGSAGLRPACGAWRRPPFIASVDSPSNVDCRKSGRKSGTPLAFPCDRQGGRMEATLKAELGSPEYVMLVARQGRIPKRVLVSLLAFDKRREFLESCALIEKKYTEACTAQNDPCLEGGCALEGEVCLQPLERAGIDYLKACGDAFALLFADPCNRIAGWGS